MKHCIAIVALFFCLACNTEPGKPAPQALTATDKPTLLKKQAMQVLDMLSRKDFESLAGQIEPGGTLLFSPYGYIDTASARRFDRVSLPVLGKLKDKLLWGQYDGSGEDIRLSAEEYMARFANDKSYAQSDSVLVNRSVGPGNSANNLADVFPGCDYVEFYCEGSDQYSGMDWGALRLVFRTVGDKVYLVAVVHDQWTI
jgi:hypothetical protein